MAQRGTSVAMKIQVIELFQRGVGRRSIARSLGLSKNTVKKILREYAATANASATAQDSKESQGMLPSNAGSSWEDAIDWEAVCKAHRAGRTIKQLIHDFASPGTSYWSFRRVLHLKVAKSPEIALRIHHQPGEKTYVDYCDGLPITDPGRGTTKKLNFSAVSCHLVARFMGSFHGIRS